MSSKHESMPEKGFSAPLHQMSHIISESSSDIPVSDDVALSRFVSIALTYSAEWS